MRSRLIILAAVFTAPLHAQTSLETGGGVARLDHFAGGAFSSFRGQIDQTYGVVQLDFKNTTIQHSGLGTSYRTDLGAETAFMLGSWEVSVGPQMRLARGIQVPSTKTFGADIGFQRQLGMIHLTGDYQRGLAWFGGQRNRWSIGDLGLSSRLGTVRIGATLHALIMTDSVPRTDVSFDLLDPRLDTLYRERVQQFEDVGMNLGWQIGRLNFSGQYGERFGSQAGGRPWWVGDVAVRIASSLAITLNSSQLPIDPLLRLYGGQYASLGLRLGGSEPSRVRREVNPDPFAVEITHISPTLVSIKFAIPGARNSASIIGEFSGWKPLPLTRQDDGTWQAVIEAAPGLYRMNIRADGGPWAVPPGIRSVADDFGGVVGLLVIP